MGFLDGMMASPNCTIVTPSKSKVCLPQLTDGSPFFDNGREIALLHFIYGHSSINEIRGSPQKVINAIDEYAQTQNYLMNVGPSKGEIVSNLILDVKPEMMVELGGYVGYSALLFGDAVRKAGGKTYLSLERNPEFAAVITSLVDLAGLSDFVKLVVGPSDLSLQRLYDDGTLKEIDLMFLDHYKPAYTSDLKLCEHLKLIKPGSVLAADNVITPGNAPYLEYVRSSIEKKREKMKEGPNDLNSFTDRYRLQHAKREGNLRLNAATESNPNLIYESRLVESVEPTGVPDDVY